LKNYWIIFLFLCLAFSISSETPLAKKKPNLVKLEGLEFKVQESENFVIHFRGPQKDAEFLQREIDKFYSVQYSKFFTTPLAVKISIILFKDKREYISKTKVPQDYLAHFEPKAKRILTFSNTQPGAIFHELIHAWLDFNSVSNTRQLWFEEGFASFFESPEKISEEEWRFDKPNWRMESAKGKWTNLKSFMQTIDLRENHSKGEARLIFLWLSKNQLLEQFVGKYHENLDFDTSGIDAIQEIVGKNIDEIDFEIQNFKAEIENVPGSPSNKKLDLE